MKNKKLKSTIALYVAAAFIFIVGTALLVNNIILYKNNVSEYVAQGYSISTVVAYYLPAQLVPGILEPVGSAYGIAFLLIAAASLNQKVSELLNLSKPEIKPDDVSEAEKTEETEEVKGAEEL